VTGTAPSAALRGVLARLRSTLSESPGRVPTAGVFAVDGTPAGQIRTPVAAPLRVTGTITVPGRPPIGVSAVLGNGRPLTKTIFLAGRGSPRIDLRVDLLDPLELLPPPNQLTLSSLQHALGAVALSWQYRHFLASPDPVGPASASYVYRTLPRSPVAARRQGSNDGSDALVIVLAATLGAAALAGLVVLWAHL
jgi:hypothetical protein